MCIIIFESRNKSNSLWNALNLCKVSVVTFSRLYFLFRLVSFMHYFMLWLSTFCLLFCVCFDIWLHFFATFTPDIFKGVLYLKFSFMRLGFQKLFLNITHFCSVKSDPIVTLPDMSKQLEKVILSSFKVKWQNNLNYSFNASHLKFHSHLGEWYWHFNSLLLSDVLFGKVFVIRINYIHFQLTLDVIVVKQYGKGSQWRSLPNIIGT